MDPLGQGLIRFLLRKNSENPPLLVPPLPGKSPSPPVVLQMPIITWIQHMEKLHQSNEKTVVEIEFDMFPKFPGYGWKCSGCAFPK